MTHMLYLSDNALTFSKHEANTHAETLLSLDYDHADALDILSKHIEEQAPKSVSIFLDVMGEEIKQENIPRVSPKDRSRIIERKKKSLFHNAEYVLSQLLYKEESGRKDFVYLLMGVSLSETNKKIIDILLHNKIEVNGIYILSILQTKIASIFDSEQFLIISDNGKASSDKHFFRKTFFDNGNLSLTRVAPVSGNHESEICYQLDKEIERTNHFLRNSKRISPDQQTRALVFLEKTYADFIIRRQDDLRIACNHVTIRELADNLKLPSPETYTSLPDVLCHLALHNKIKPHLEPKQLCHQKNVRIKKKNILTSAIAIFALALLTSLVFVVAQISHRNNIGDQQGKLANLRFQDEQLTRNLPETVIDPKVMQDAVKLYQAINSNNHFPEEIFQDLAHAFDGFSSLSIKNIHWSYRDTQSNDENTTSAKKTTAFMDTLKIPLKIALTLTPSEQLSNREAIETVKAFQYALLERPSVQSVEEVQRTIDTRPNKLLEENFLAARQFSSSQTRFFTVIATLENTDHAKQ